jgi:hypothetical protein
MPQPSKLFLFFQVHQAYSCLRDFTCAVPCIGSSSSYTNCPPQRSPLWHLILASHHLPSSFPFHLCKIPHFKAWHFVSSFVVHHPGWNAGCMRVILTQSAPRTVPSNQ